MNQWKTWTVNWRERAHERKKETKRAHLSLSTYHSRTQESASPFSQWSLQDRCRQGQSSTVALFARPIFIWMISLSVDRSQVWWLFYQLRYKVRWRKRKQPGVFTDIEMTWGIPILLALTYKGIRCWVNQPVEAEWTALFLAAVTFERCWYVVLHLVSMIFGRHDVLSLAMWLHNHNYREWLARRTGNKFPVRLLFLEIARIILTQRWAAQ